MVLYDLIGYTGMSKAAKDVVDGTFLEKYGDELGDILPETEQVIRGLAMPEEIKVLGKKIDYEISEEDFISGFKGWKESTSTSPSGQHLGHYKAIVTDPDLKKQDPEKAHLRRMRNQFCHGSCQVAEYPTPVWLCTKTMVYVCHSYD